MTRAQGLENAEASELRYLQATRRDEAKNRATEILTVRLRASLSLPAARRAARTDALALLQGQWKEQQWAPQLVLVEPMPPTSRAGTLTESDSSSLSDLDLDI